LAREIRHRWQLHFGLGSVLGTMMLAGCSLSPEQLALPGPITGATNSSSLAGPPSDSGRPERREADIREGSGQFTGEAPGSRGGSGRAASRVDADGVTLNLVGASVPEVAKTVLGDVLKVNYTVSDKVKASITLSTAQPVAKDELLKIFEYVLRSEGIAIAEEGGVYHILPADAAPNRSPRWSGTAQGKVGTGTAIVPLRYVSAAEMERVLKSVAPQTSVLRVDNARNLLLVSGTPSELESINATVDTFDVDWMRGMSFALLPLESGDPEAVAKELDTVFANDTDSPTKGIIRFIPNSRLKAVLVISSRPEYLKRAANWVKRIDLAGQATEKQVHVYHVQNRPAVELAALLGKVYNAQSGNRVVTSATQTVETAAVVSTGEGNDEAAGQANVAQGFPPGFALNQARTGRQAQNGQNGALPDIAEAAAGEGEQTGGRNGTGAGGIGIVPDEPNNALIITATAQEYTRIRRILSRIDIAANQVLLEATIAEVTLNDELRFGLKWFFEKGNNSATFSTASSGAIAQAFPGFSYFLNTPNVQVALNALNQVTTVNLVSSPTLMVLDNKKAVLQIGDEVPVPTQQAQSVLVPGAPIVNSISYKNTGVILSITPRVGDNGRIQLDIEQEVSDVKAGTSTPNEDGSVPAPTIAQRRVKTAVAVGDGEAIMLGGLMRDQSTVGNTKVPLVGDIPVVGNLFKSKNDTISRTELFIAITPHVVKDPRQIRGIADEFRDRMNLTTRPQRAGPPDRRENADRLAR
jgi:general secretion pathway protein D